MLAKARALRPVSMFSCSHQLLTCHEVCTSSHLEVVSAVCRAKVSCFASGLRGCR